MGGSFGKNESEQQQSSSFNEDVWGTQGDALSQLYQQALGIGGNQFQGNINDIASSASSNASQYNDTMSSGINNMMSGGAYGDAADIRNKLYQQMGMPSQMGQMYNSIVGGEGNTYIDPLVERMRADSAKNVSTMQNSNALDAAAAGQNGSSRQAMQNAMLASEEANNLANREMQARAGAYDTDLNMKMNIAQMADSNGQMNQDRLMQMLSGNQNSVTGAMSSLPTAQSMTTAGMAPYMQAYQSQWSPSQYLQSILGSPLVLGSGNSNASAESKGLSGGGGFWG